MSKLAMIEHGPGQTGEAVMVGRLARCSGRAVDVGYVARRLQPDDFVALRALHLAVVGATPPGLVATETDGFLWRNLGQSGLTFGVFVERRMIAYGILSFPRDDRESLAAGLVPGIEPDRSAVLDGAGVLPDWWGNGLQRTLSTWRIEVARRQARWHVSATSAPANPYSWRNLMSQGLVIRDLRRMYGGHWRYILHRDLRRPAVRGGAAAIAVPVGEIERQRGLLAAGYQGWGARPSAEGLEILFERTVLAAGGLRAAEVPPP